MTFLLVCVMQVKSASVMADQFPYYIYTSTSKDQDMEAYEEYKFYENNDFNRNKYLNSDVNNKIVNISKSFLRKRIVIIWHMVRNLLN